MAEILNLAAHRAAREQRDSLPSLEAMLALYFGDVLEEHDGDAEISLVVRETAQDGTEIITAYQFTTEKDQFDEPS